MRIQFTLTQYLIYFFLAFFTLSSCKKTLEEERTYSENRSIESFLAKNNWKFTNEDGIYHVVRVKSYGYQVAKGDTIEFWYIGYTLEGKVFDTNIKSEAKTAELDTLIRSFDPITTIAGMGKLIDGLDDGLLHMREGEYATILFSSSFGFGDNAMGPVESWSPIAYDVVLIKVNGVNIQKEKNYLGSLNPAASGFSEDPSGLYFKYVFLGLGSSPTITDTIYGWYRGALPDGTIVEDLGVGNQPIALSSSSIPEGVKLGFMLTLTGGTTNLVLPSYLGYGNQGNTLVEPYQTLYYQIRLDSIK
jgi:FKBP-type peptidyl-prolyl cis-trans isomerase